MGEFEYKVRSNNTLDYDAIQEKVAKTQAIKDYDTSGTNLHRGTPAEFAWQVAYGAADSATFNALATYDEVKGLLDNDDLYDSFQEQIAGQYAGDFTRDLSNWGRAGYMLGSALSLPLSMGASSAVGKTVVGGTGKLINWGLKKLGGKGFGVQKAKDELVDRGSKIIATNNEKLSRTLSSKADEIIEDSFEVMGNSNQIMKVIKKLDEDIYKDVATKQIRNNMKEVLDLPDTRSANKLLQELAEETFEISYRNSPMTADNMFNLMGYRTRQALNFMSGGLGNKFGNPENFGLIFGSMYMDASIGMAHGMLRSIIHDRIKYKYDEDYHKVGGADLFIEHLTHGAHDAMIFSLMGPPKFVKNLRVGRFGVGASQRTMTRDLGKYISGSYKAYTRDLKKMSNEELRRMLDLMDDISDGQLNRVLGDLRNTEKWSNLGARWWNNPVVQGKFKTLDDANLAHKLKMIENIKQARNTFAFTLGKRLPKEFLAETFSAIPRMALGTLAMNAPNIYATYKDGGSFMNAFGTSWQERWMNLLTASYFTRKPHSFNVPPTGKFFDRLVSKGRLEQYYNHKHNEFRKMMGSLHSIGAKDHISISKIMGKYGTSSYRDGEYEAKNNMINKELDRTLEHREISRVLDKYIGLSENRVNTSIIDGQTVFADWISALNKFIKDELVKGTIDQNTAEIITNKRVIAEGVLEHFNRRRYDKIDLTSVTPREAFDLVDSLSSIQFSNKKLDHHNVDSDLRLWAESKAAEIDRVPQKLRQDYIEDFYSTLEIDYHKDRDTGVLSLRDIRGREFGSNEVKENFVNVINDGVKNGWIKLEALADRRTLEAISQENLNKIIEPGGLHDRHTEMFMDYALPNWRENKIVMDRNIIGNEIWGEGGFDLANKRTQKNLYEVLTLGGEYTIAPSDATNFIQKTEILKTIERPSIDSESWGNIKASERGEIETFLNRLHNIVKLINPDISNKSTRPVSAKKINELRSDVNKIFGNILEHQDSYDSFINYAEREAIRSLGLNSVFKGIDIRTSFLHLVRDPLFNNSRDGKEIRMPRPEDVRKVLAVAELNNKISTTERIKLEEHYDTITTELAEANMGNVYGQGLQEATSGDWVNALTNSRDKGLHHISDMATDYIQTQLRALKVVSESMEMRAELLRLGIANKGDKKLSESQAELVAELELRSSQTRSYAKDLEDAIRYGDKVFQHAALTKYAEFTDVIQRIRSLSLDDMDMQYFSAIAKYSNDVIERVNREVMNERTIDEMIREKIALETVPDKDVQNRIFKLSQQMFSSRYGINAVEFDAIVGIVKRSMKDAKDVKSYIKTALSDILSRDDLGVLLADNPQLLDRINLWKSVVNDPNLKGVVDLKKQNQFYKYVYEPLLDRIMIDEHIKSLEAKAEGKTYEMDLFQIESDVYSVTSSFFSKVPVKKLKFDQQSETLIQSYDLAGDVPRGFRGVQRYLDSDAGFNIFLLESNGIDINGRTFDIGSRLEMVDNMLANGEYGTTNIYGRNKLFNSRTKENQELALDFDPTPNQRFKVVALNESTFLAVRVDTQGTNVVRTLLKEQFGELGELYEKMSALYDGDIRANDKTGFALNLLERLRKPTTDADIIEGIKLTYYLLSNPFAVPKIVDIKGVNIHSELIQNTKKYIKPAEPKNTHIGTEENLARTAEFYRNAKSPVMEAVYKEIKDMIEPVDGKYRKLRFTSVSDEIAKHNDGVSDVVNLFDSLARYESELQAKLKAGKITDIDMQTSLEVMEGWHKSIVDGDFYVSKKTFLAGLAQLGINGDMLNTSIMPDGSIRIDGFKGAIKPSISKSEIDHLKLNPDGTPNPNYGNVSVWMAKTAWKFDPVIGDWLDKRGLDGITFGSANKINQNKPKAGVQWDNSDPKGDQFKTKAESDNNRNRFIRLNDLKADKQIKVKDETVHINENIHTLDWMSEITKLTSNDIKDHHITEVSWGDISLRKVSKEADASISANLGNHLSHDSGIAGWTGVVEKVNTHLNTIIKQHRNPYYRTALSKKVYAMSAELGDVINSSTMMAMLERNPILMNPFAGKKLEMDLIGYLLNNGNISGGSTNKGSYDVMAADRGIISSPVRSVIGDKQVVKQFGEKEMSYFSSQKRFTVESIDGPKNGSSKIIQSGLEYMIIDSRSTTELIPGYPAEGKAKRDNVDGFFVNVAKQDILVVEGRGITKDGKIIDLETFKPLYEKALNSKDLAFNKATFNKAFELNKRMIEHLQQGSKKITWSVSDVAVELRSQFGDLVAMGQIDSRQPRNQIGDLVITKVPIIKDKVTGELKASVDPNSGNISRMNYIDAIRSQDADFDFDQSFSYTSAPEKFWKEVGRVAGDIGNEPAHIAVENILSAFTQELPGLMGADLRHTSIMNEVHKVKARWIKMHQTLTYLKNMFSVNDKIMSFEASKIGIAGGRKYEQWGVEFKKDNYNTSVKMVSDWAKLYIDMYRNMLENPGKRIQDRQFDILFGEKGLFKIVNEDGVMHDTNLMKPEYRAIRDAVVDRFIRPINQYVAYNRGSYIDPANNPQKALLSDYAYAYEKMFNNYQLKNKESIRDWMNIEPGLTAMNDYFAISKNPYDLAMSGLHSNWSQYGKLKTMESRADKYLDPTTEIVSWIKDGYENIRGATREEKYQNVFQNALKQFVYAEGGTYRLQELSKRISDLEFKISEKETYSRDIDKMKLEDPQYQRYTKEMARLVELKTSMQEAIGYKFKDEILMDSETLYNPGYGKGEFYNSKSHPVVIVGNKGQIKEVVAKNKSNFYNIGKGDKLILNGRRFQVSSPVEQKALRSIFEMLAGEVTFNDGEGRRIQISGQHEKSVIKPLLTEIAEKVSVAYERNKNRPRAQRGEAMALARQNAILDAFNRDIIKNNEIYTYALAYRLVRPLTSKKVINTRQVISELGRQQVVDFLYMENPMSETFFNILAQIESGQREGRGITVQQASELMTNIITLQNIGYEQSSNRYLDYRLQKEKYFTSPTDINQGYMTKDRHLNKTIYELSMVDDTNARNSAKILIDYAEGRGTSTSVDRYRAWRDLNRIAEIPSNRIFGTEMLESMSNGNVRTYGESYIFVSDVDSRRVREWGRSLREEANKELKERIRCLAEGAN